MRFSVHNSIIFVASSSSLLACFYLWQTNNCGDVQDEYESSQKIHPRTDEPLIVQWNDVFGEPILKFIKTKDCEYSCTVMNRSHWNSNLQPAAYLIHGKTINTHDLPKKTAHNAMVFFIRESPVHASKNLQKLPPDYFNATITYTKKSSYFLSWGSFKPKSSNDENAWAEKEIHKVVQKKSKGALAFISNCKTYSKREQVIRELKEYTNITIVGNCPGLATFTGTCPRDSECEQKLIESHRFYLSFENSECEDYITEKFFKRVEQLLVPVVLNRTIYQVSQIAQDSFMAASDYSSIEDLGKAIERLTRNDEEYIKFFDWTKYYQKSIFGGEDQYCNLCRDLHRNKKMFINNFSEIYSVQQCQA